MGLKTLSYAYFLNNKNYFKHLFEGELEKHSKTISLINQNLTAQEKILKVLTESNANFAELRKQILENNEKLVFILNI